MIDIGIPQAKRAEIVTGLSELLADSYTLYLKTHNYHWNVTGPMFQALHTMFETHYTELALAVDEVAERIRALGEKAPGSYREFSTLTAIEERSETLSAEEMVSDLLASHETLIRRARGRITLAEEASDQATADLLTQRIQVHEKSAWMLRTILE